MKSVFFLVISALFIHHYECKRLLCNNNENFSFNIEYSISYGECTFLKEDSNNYELSVHFTEHNKEHPTSLLPDTIYTIPTQTNSFFTHDLIDRIHPSPGTFQAMTQYVQWKDSHTVPFCSPLHCITLPYQFQFYVFSIKESNSPSPPEENIICPDGKILTLRIGSQGSSHERVCVTVTAQEGRQDTTFYSTSQTAHFITSYRPYTITSITHSQTHGTEEAIEHDTDPAARIPAYPYHSFSLHSYLRLSKERFVSEEKREGKENINVGPGFAVTATFFNLTKIPGTIYIIRTPTTIYTITKNDSNELILHSQKPTIWRDSKEMEREVIIVQDFDTESFPLGPEALPDTGRYSAMYHETWGYEKREGRTVTGAKALKRFLDMVKEWEERDDTKYNSTFMGEKELAYWKGGETYLYSLRTAWRNLRKTTSFAKAFVAIQQLKKRDWDKEGEDIILARREQKIHEKTPEWLLGWQSPKKEPKKLGGKLFVYFVLIVVVLGLIVAQRQRQRGWKSAGEGLANAEEPLDPIDQMEQEERGEKRGEKRQEEAINREEERVEEENGEEESGEEGNEEEGNGEEGSKECRVE